MWEIIKWEREEQRQAIDREQQLLAEKRKKKDNKKESNVSQPEMEREKKQ